jgi:hypothetical protein
MVNDGGFSGRKAALKPDFDSLNRVAYIFARTTSVRIEQ